MPSSTTCPAAFTQPPALQKGDLIGLICPAGYMPLEKTEQCRATLASWGYRTLVGSSVGHQHHYFAGTDDERLADLQAMLDNPDVKAILCARGGYGTSRIIDKVNWRAFKKNPKWIIGYSDVTVLHSYLYSRLHTCSLHAPMANAFNDGGWQNEYVQSLRRALAGKLARYKAAPHPLNRSGKASGRLVGGNLSLLAHQIGSPSDVNTDGCILFIEDVGEYLYNIDRMLLQLRRAGKLRKLAGLVVGGFTELKDTSVGFGQTVHEIIAAHVAGLDYPVCFDFPVSHDTPNYALKVGALYQLSVGRTVSLQELAY
jgi:muramoyltetrapeptide carboxypeptidase